MQILRSVLNLGRDLFVGLAGVLGMGEYGAGFLMGLVVSGLIGFLLFRVNIWMRQASAAFQPQRIMQMTSRTPAQVLGSSIGNTFRISGVLVVLLTLVFLLTGLAWPGDAAVTGAFGILLLLVGGVMA